MLPPSPVVLVDVMSLAWQSHYAFRGLSHEGQPTGVYHGFLKTVLRLRERVSSRMVFCWDHGIPVLGAVPAPCWRKAVFPAYKSDRKKDNPDFAAMVGQLPGLFHVLSDYLNYCNVAVPGLEADDLISLLCYTFPTERFAIFSSDHDLYQILDPSGRVRVLRSDKRGNTYHAVTAKEVESEFGIPVAKWAQYLALGGDTADHIKPWRGAGPGTAAKLIAAGADPRLPFTDQPPFLQERYAKLASNWVSAKASYYVACLPRHWSDVRISPLVKANGGPPNVYLEPRPDSEGYLQFQTFCADHALLELFSNRRKFFAQEPI